MRRNVTTHPHFLSNTILPAPNSATCACARCILYNIAPVSILGSLETKRMYVFLESGSSTTVHASNLA